MNLHIVNDEKFINNSIKTFEQYYEGQNIFIVQLPKSKLNAVYVNKTEQTFFLSLTEKKSFENILQIIDDYHIENIFVHYLNPHKAHIVNKIKKKRNIRTYWMFYGADLYSLLNKKFGYKLYDRPQNKSFYSKALDLVNKLKFFIIYKTPPFTAYASFVKNLDYFCFWNHYDYQLLKKYFITNAKFKEFGYYNNSFTHFEKNSTNKINILVNNSASSNGNHITVLEKLKILDNDCKIDKIIVPLSYGNSNVKRKVLEYGYKNHNNIFFPLIDFYKTEDYLSIISEVTVAIFGARRQEAAGNIFFMLQIGAKVFLREDNNMLIFLRDKNFIVYSFDKDLNDISGLEPLTNEEKAQNYKAYNDFYNPERKDFIMRNLITEQ